VRRQQGEELGVDVGVGGLRGRQVAAGVGQEGAGDRRVGLDGPDEVAGLG
jgi:hypothetical protein